MSAASHEVEEVLEMIQMARDFREALAIFFDSVLVSEEIERALVLLEFCGELRGMRGVGWDPAVARAISIPLDDDVHPLARAFRSGKPTNLHCPADAGGLQEGDYVMLPMRGVGRIPLGVLLIGPGEADVARFSALGEKLIAVSRAAQPMAEQEWPRQSRIEATRERDLLQAVVDALPDPVFVTDSVNGVILHNRRAEAFFVSGEDDNEGRRRAVEINNLFFSAFLTETTFLGDDPVRRELNLVDPFDGGDLLFEVLASPVPTHIQGEGVSVSVLRDVTDLKQASAQFEQQFKRLRQVELRSRRENDRLNMILENVGDPILVTDDESDIILMNLEAERLFGIPDTGDPSPRRRREVDANGTRFSSFISDFALSQDFTRVAHFPLVDPETGLEFPAEAVSGKVLNDHGEVAVIVTILHDLTEVVENKRLAAELARLNEGLEGRISEATGELEERNRRLEWQSQELEQAYRLQSQFLASMSHELRTPINSLLGYTSLMRDRIYGELTPPQQEAMERMYLASNHLLELVNDILDLAKIKAGKMPVHVESVELPRLIEEVVQTVEPMIRRKELEFRFEIDDDLPLMKTDRTKVKQVILNLLSNAVKFTSEGEVTVRAGWPVEPPDRLPPSIQIVVSDTGIGIDPEDLRTIFDDFRQIDQSSTREHGGTGLGLSITRKLLGLLGGAIEVDSVVGQGSTFTVFLPLRSERRLPEEVAPEDEDTMPEPASPG